MFREGLRQVLAAESDFEVCGMAGSAEQALPNIVSLLPDLALVDVSLPGKSGIALIREIRSQKLAVKLLVLSMHDEALYADRVLRAGGDGYIMKEEDPAEIVQAIRDVLAGRIYVSEDVLASRSKDVSKSSSKEVRPLGRLTDTQLDIFERLGRRSSRRDIAHELHLSPRALAEECAQIRQKLNLPTDAATARMAIELMTSQAN